MPNIVSEIPKAIEATQARRKEIEEGQSTSSAAAGGKNAASENKTNVQEQDVSDPSPTEDNEDNSGENGERSPPSNDHAGGSNDVDGGKCAASAGEDLHIIYFMVHNVASYSSSHNHAWKVWKACGCHVVVTLYISSAMRCCGCFLSSLPFFGVTYLLLDGKGLTNSV